jgi:dGTPase
VVKLADKISYVGRDIEDAITIGILDREKIETLSDILSCGKKEKLNNTVIINKLINDLCQNSSIEDGLTLSLDCFEMLNAIKNFNYQNIYLSDRLAPSARYFNLVINEIYETLKKTYAGVNTALEIQTLGRYYPNLSKSFLDWIGCYWELTVRTESNLKNSVVYEILHDQKNYYKAILDYISGMTDNFAIDTYNEIIRF